MSEKAKVVQLDYNWNGMVLTVESKELGRKEVFDCGALDDSIKQQAMRMGFRTKIGNNATEEREHADKLDAMVEGFAILKDGDWEREREKLPAWIKTTEFRQAIAAIARLQGATESAVRSTVAKLPKDKAAALIKNEKIQAKVKEMTSAAADLDLSVFQ